jgi:pseudaminic acid biosynthesis-associated methylase
MKVIVKKTVQMKKWGGSFGKEYTLRNPYTFEDTENLFLKLYGIKRTEMNSTFIGDLERSIKVLEVGCNVGGQLIVLQKMGFTDLYGIELQENAVQFSKSITKDINIIKGSAFDIPFKDNYFDLVYTSGVLIHIAPEDIIEVIRGIYRTTRKYIWGFEYFAEDYTEIPYRGERNLLWKANFAKMYLDNFRDLTLLKEIKFKYLRNDNADQMFLLEKCDH